jgi:DNA-binding CsgD family transcriptional regulator
LDLSKWISKNDALVMLEIIHKSLVCKTKTDFLMLLEELKGLFYFERSVSGLADVMSILQGEEVSSHYINGGYPEEYLSLYLEQGLHLKDVVMQEFFKSFEIQNFKELDPLYDEIPDNPVLGLCQDFGMLDGFIYGTCDNDLRSSTSFCFTGQKAENNQRTRTIIKYVVPHLSEALKRLVAVPRKRTTSLTSSEVEVLKWLKEGKTTWETSSILNKSERAIKFHINNILKKLNAMNRTHAVAIALENHLIKL